MSRETRAIIGFRKGLGCHSIEKQISRLPPGVEAVGTVPTLGLATVRSEGSLSAVRTITRERCNGIQFVEPDQPVPAPTPVNVGSAPDNPDSDPDRYADQPALKRINVPEAVNTIAAEVEHPYISRVAHVDGGIDYTHPELASTYVAGRDFVADDEAPDPGQRYPTHGTKAGSVFGADPRTKRITGVTPHAAALACQAYGEDLGGESGLVSHIADAISWATEQGVDIILLVVQPRKGSEALKRAVNHAASEGVFMAASTGNFGWEDRVAYPARYDAVFGVGASDDGDRAGFSNVGPGMDIYAPGVDIRVVDRSKGGDQIATADGTSFSGPILAAVATLLLAADPSLTREGIARILRETADSGPTEHGGIVNAKAAVDRVLSASG